MYTSPPLRAGLKPDTWVTISRQRPTLAEIAPHEAALEAFLMASPGSLEGIPKSARLQQQVGVPGTKKTVDILATTDRAITIIELKKAAGALGVGQLVQYVDAWKKTTEADGRAVRGILVSGVENEDTRRAIEDACLAGHDLSWYVYKLNFSMKPMRMAR